VTLCNQAIRGLEQFETRTRQELQLRLDRLAIEWSDDLLSQLARSDALFDVLVKFLTNNGIGKRCTVLRAYRNAWELVCRNQQNGRIDVKRGTRFRHPQGGTIHMMRRSAKAVLVRGPASTVTYTLDGYDAVRQTCLNDVGLLRLPVSGEWVEMPLRCHDALDAIVIVEKCLRSDGPAPWTGEELRFLTDIGHITSQALGRLVLEEQLERESLYALSMAAFRHEVDHSIIRLKNAAEKFRDIPAVHTLTETAHGQMEHIEKLQTFFRTEILDIDDSVPRYITIAEEIAKAIDLLPDNHWRLVLPKSPIRALIPGLRRPLCLILLQLLTNALTAVDAQAAPRIVVGYERLQPPYGHRLSVEDNGPGFTNKDYATLGKTLGRLHVEPWRPGKRRVPGGLGLLYARLVACRLGWSIRLTSPRDPTRWTIEIPGPQL
jgi:hypothetical protein